VGDVFIGFFVKSEIASKDRLDLDAIRRFAVNQQYIVKYDLESLAIALLRFSDME